MQLTKVCIFYIIISIPSYGNNICKGKLIFNKSTTKKAEKCFDLSYYTHINSKKISLTPSNQQNDCQILKLMMLTIL